MRLNVVTSEAKGAGLYIADFAADTVLDLAEALNSGDEQFLTFELDGETTVLLNRDHIVRVEVLP